MNTKKCEKCGVENPINSEFCAECGVKLSEKINNESTNPISRWFSNWNRKSNSYKVITGLLGCCVGAFIIIMIFTALNPTTALSLDNSTINIDNQTTEYLLKGKTEAGATVKISSKTLNIDNVEIKPSSDGKFEYKLQIPTNTNESEVTITAKVPNKSQNQQTATIKRPSATQTSTNSNNNAPSNAKTYNSQGLTFKYPDTWTINETGEIKTPNSVGGRVMNDGSLTEWASEEPAIPATLDAAAEDIRSGVLGDSEKKEITIGGVRGIEYIPKGYNSYGTQRVDIIFVKGDTLYSIFLTTNNYNADKDGIEMIINTMQIQ